MRPTGHDGSPNFAFGARPEICRCQGELLALCYEVSAETVRCYRRRALRRPPSQSWRTFLANHRPQLSAADFFTVQTLTFKMLYVFFFITRAAASCIST